MFVSIEILSMTLYIQAQVMLLSYAELADRKEFQFNMCVVYCDLNNEDAVEIAGRHNSDSRLHNDMVRLSLCNTRFRMINAGACSFPV